MQRNLCGWLRTVRAHGQHNYATPLRACAWRRAACPGPGRAHAGRCPPWSARTRTRAPTTRPQHWPRPRAQHAPRSHLRSSSIEIAKNWLHTYSVRVHANVRQCLCPRHTIISARRRTRAEHSCHNTGSVHESNTPGLASAQQQYESHVKKANVLNCKELVVYVIFLRSV